MTTVTHPITGKAYPLILNARAAGESVGMNEQAIVRLCVAREIQAAPHADLERWRIYTIPLWRKFGLLMSEVIAV